MANSSGNATRIFGYQEYKSRKTPEERLEYLQRFYKNVHVQPMLRVMADKGWTFAEIVAETLPPKLHPNVGKLRLFALNANAVELQADAPVTRAVVAMSGFKTLPELMEAVQEGRFKLLQALYPNPLAEPLVRHMARTGEGPLQMSETLQADKTLPDEIKIAPGNFSQLLNAKTTPYDRRGKTVIHSRTAKAATYIIMKGLKQTAGWETQVNLLFPLDKAPPIGTAAPTPTRRRFRDAANMGDMTVDEKLEHWKQWYPNIHVLPVLKIMAEENLLLRDVIATYAPEYLKDYGNIRKSFANDGIYPERDSAAIAAVLKITGIASFEQLMESVWEARYAVLKKSYKNPDADALVEHMARTGATLLSMAASLPAHLQVEHGVLEQFLSGDIQAVIPAGNRHTVTGLAVAWLVRQDANDLFPLKDGYTKKHAVPFVDFMINNRTNIHKLSYETGIHRHVIRKFLKDERKAYSPDSVQQHSDVCLRLCKVASLDPNVLFPLSLHPKLTDPTWPGHEIVTREGRQAAYIKGMRKRFTKKHAAPFIDYINRDKMNMLQVAGVIGVNNRKAIKDFLNNVEEAYSPTSVERHSYVCIRFCELAGVNRHQLFPLHLHHNLKDDALKADGVFIQKDGQGRHVAPFVNYMSENLLTFKDMARKTGTTEDEIKDFFIDKELAYDKTWRMSNVCLKLCQLVGVQDLRKYLEFLEGQEDDYGPVRPPGNGKKPSNGTLPRNGR